MFNHFSGRIELVKYKVGIVFLCRREHYNLKVLRHQPQKRAAVRSHPKLTQHLVVMHESLVQIENQCVGESRRSVLRWQQELKHFLRRPVALKYAVLSSVFILKRLIFRVASQRDALANLVY